VLFGVLFCGGKQEPDLRYGPSIFVSVLDNGVERVAVLKLWLAGLLAGGSRIPACADKLTFRLQQTQLAGTCDRFGAPLDLEFVKDFPIVSFHRVQGEEKPLANLMIRESLSNEVEYF